MDGGSVLDGFTDCKEQGRIVEVIGPKQIKEIDVERFDKSRSGGVQRHGALSVLHAMRVSGRI